MALVVVSDGRISSNILTPRHDATVHENSAVIGETYSTYFPADNQTHYSTLTGLGTKTEVGGVVTVGTGAGIGSSRFTRASLFTPSTTMAVFRFKIASVTNGADNYRMTHIGLTFDFTTDDPETVDYIGFVQDSLNSWSCACHGNLNYSIGGIPALVVGDILTIAVSSTAVYFYVNDHLVFTPNPNSIPSGAMSVGFSVVGTNVPTSTRELGIKYYGPAALTGWDVANTPAGTIAATYVQSAINELDTEKLARGVNPLTPDANIAIDPTLGNVATLTPDQATALTIDPATLPGHILTIILTATSVDRTVTFSTGFKGLASQATGTTADKKFITMWVSDGADYVYRGSGGPF